MIEADLIGRLLTSMDRAIEQAKAELPADRSQVPHLIQQQKDLRRASVAYRQEPSDENRAQPFVDYHDAYQAYVQLTQTMQKVFQENAQEYQRVLDQAEVEAEPYRQAVDEAHAGAEPYLRAVEEVVAGAQPYHQALMEAQAGAQAHRRALAGCAGGGATLPPGPGGGDRLWKPGGHLQDEPGPESQYYMKTVQTAYNALTEFYANSIQAANKALTKYYTEKVQTAQEALTEYHAKRIQGAQEALDSFWAEHELS